MTGERWRQMNTEEEKINKMSNNLTKIKMKKVTNTQPEVKETKKDALRRLFKRK